jgi:1,2-diacylglycerol-3-alpha-glucose alpha-1,2-galactosyltransferase
MTNQRTDFTVNIITESEFFPKSHGVHTAYLNNVALLKQQGITPSINSLRKSDITHIHTIGPFSLFQLLINKPTVVTAHVIPDSFVGSLKGAKSWYKLAKLYLSFFYNQADLVLAVAPKVKESLISLKVKKSIEIFSNPIDTNMFKPLSELKASFREKFGFKDTNKIALGVGQVQTRKGIEVFLEVAKLLPDIKFIWIGSQPLKILTDQGGVAEAIKNKSSNVLFLENIPYSQMPKYINMADIFLFPSYQENAPMAVIEAAACGLPLVLRDLKEYKMLYKEGYLFANTTNEFVEIIKKLIDDKNYYLKAQKNSFNLAKKFSLEALGVELINHYQKLLNLKR